MTRQLVGYPVASDSGAVAAEQGGASATTALSTQPPLTEPSTSSAGA